MLLSFGPDYVLVTRLVPISFAIIDEKSIINNRYNFILYIYFDNNKNK